MKLIKMVFVVLDAWKQIWDLLDLQKYGLNIYIYSEWIA
jgi:hypothetical protein